ncbi:MAG: ribosome biogenesis factor YjgA [Betaproteobacteria bacterium]
MGRSRSRSRNLRRIITTMSSLPIRAALDALEGHSRAHTAWLHRLERLREQLVDADQGWDALAATHPGADLQRLRQLARSARAERAAARPLRAFRELFQALRELIPEPQPDSTAPVHEHE